MDMQLSAPIWTCAYPKRLEHRQGFGWHCKTNATFGKRWKRPKLARQFSLCRWLIRQRFLLESLWQVAFGQFGF